MTTTLTVENLVIEYISDGYAVRPVDGLSFEASGGELVVLLGPSGSGKTSLLSALAGILTPSSGRIRVGDTEVTSLDAAGLARYRRSEVGVVFQAFNLIPSLTAAENVAAPLLVSGMKRGAAMARARQLLETVHLEDRAHHRPGALSGGQQQRVAVARGLVSDPPVLLADEPTANLDYVNAEAIIALLRELRSEGRLIVVSTHDDRMVHVADRVVEMVAEFHPEAIAPQRVEYAAGETIFEQGSRGQLVYTIEAGEVDVVRSLASGGERHLATLGAGRYVGELGPLLGFPRSATVRARTDVVLTAYGVRHFREHVLGEPAVESAVESAVEPAVAPAPRPARRKAARHKTAAPKAEPRKAGTRKAVARKAPAARSAPATAKKRPSSGRGASKKRAARPR